MTVSEEEDVMPNDDNICNEIINGQQDVVTVTCDYKNRNPPIRGHFVTIRRKDNTFERQYMNFCEVEVRSCPPGRWGYNLPNLAPDCSQSCDRCNNTVETCRVSDGYCFIACKKGFWGGSCDKQCDCLNNVLCNPTDGSCPSGKSEQDMFAVSVEWPNRLTEIKVDFGLLNKISSVNGCQIAKHGQCYAAK